LAATSNYVPAPCLRETGRATERRRRERERDLLFVPLDVVVAAAADPLSSQAARALLRSPSPPSSSPVAICHFRSAPSLHFGRSARSPLNGGGGGRGRIAEKVKLPLAAAAAAAARSPFGKRSFFSLVLSHSVSSLSYPVSLTELLPTSTVSFDVPFLSCPAPTKPSTDSK